MPEHFRAFAIIIILASALFFAAEKSCLAFVNLSEFKRWRNLWFASTFAAFLSHDFWLYALAISVLIIIYSLQYKNNPALFLLLLFIVPAGNIQATGFGLVNYLFELNQSRLLALLILVPCLLSVSRPLRSGGSISDGLFLSYILLIILLQLPQTTITNTARFSFHLFLDAALPYYVFSRSLKDIQAFRQTLLCLVLACLVISLISIFEFGKHWLLYSSLPGVLGLEFQAGYSDRSDMLRASGPAGHPIVLGYLIMVAIGFYLFLMKNIDGAMRRHTGLALLIGGLIVALSRGPWLGTIVMIGVFVSTGRTPLRHLIGLGLAGVLGLASLAIIPGGEKVINLLPYIGTTEIENIEYRERLFANSLIVIQRNFWFGSVDYLQTSEMQDMIQGQGIIDIVNTYIRIALSSGIVGLAIFVAFFASTIVSVWRAIKSVKVLSSDEHILGRSLLATMIAVLFTIATVSSIMNIPIIYWSLAGMLVGYSRLINNATADNDHTPNGIPVRAKILRRIA